MHPSRTPIRSLVAVVKWLERRQSFYIWHKGLPAGNNKPRFVHHGWLQNMTIPTIRGLVASGAIYRALSDEKDISALVRDGFAKKSGSWEPTPKPARAPRPHWTARLKAR